MDMKDLAVFSDADKRIREFATQVAMQVEDFSSICKSFGMTEAQGESLQQHPAYKTYYEGALAEWAAAHNTGARAELKAARAVEEAIPAVFAHIHDPEASDTSKIEAFKALGKLGRVGERGINGGGAGGDMVKITINLGADQKLTFEKAAPVIEHEAVTA